MKAIQHEKYSKEFPENFNWHLVDRGNIERIAFEISNMIDEDARTISRSVTPGLRIALNIMAEQTDLYATED